MKILKWKNKMYGEIPENESPFLNERECLIIYKIQEGEWGVHHYKKTHTDDFELFIIGLFWEFKDAELFAKAYNTKDETTIELRPEDLQKNGSILFIINKETGQITIKADRIEKFEILGLLEMFKIKITENVKKEIHEEQDR